MLSLLLLPVNEFADQPRCSGTITVRHAEIHQDESIHGAVLTASPCLHRLKCLPAIAADVLLEPKLSELALYGHLIEAAIFDKEDLICAC